MKNLYLFLWNSRECAYFFSRTLRCLRSYLWFCSVQTITINTYLSYLIDFLTTIWHPCSKSMITVVWLGGWGRTTVCRYFPLQIKHGRNCWRNYTTILVPRYKVSKLQLTLLVFEYDQNKNKVYTSSKR